MDNLNRVLKKQLNLEVTQRYGKPEGSTFTKREKKTVGDYKDIAITTLSPYPFDLPTNQQRPPDYFDRRETMLDFKYGEDDIVIKIWGKGREERMDVTINGVPMEFQGRDLVLNMNETFPEENMALLLKKAEDKSHKKIKIGKSLEVWTANFLTATSHVRVKDYFSRALNEMTRDRLDTIIVPVVTRSAPFNSNDQGTHGHHWYTCMFSFKNPRRPVMTVVESTNKLKTQTPTEIINSYITEIVTPFNELLSGSSSFNHIALNQIRYAQGTQYGNSGCGITASLNVKRLLARRNFKVLTLKDVSYDDVFYKVSETCEQKLNKQQDPKALVYNELVTLRKIYGADNVFVGEEKFSQKDISVKGNIVLEALQRFELAKLMLSKEQSQKDTQAEVITPENSEYRKGIFSQTTLEDRVQSKPQRR